MNTLRALLTILCSTVFTLWVFAAPTNSTDSATNLVKTPRPPSNLRIVTNSQRVYSIQERPQIDPKPESIKGPSLRVNLTPTEKVAVLKELARHPNDKNSVKRYNKMAGTLDRNFLMQHGLLPALGDTNVSIHAVEGHLVKPGTKGPPPIPNK